MREAEGTRLRLETDYFRKSNNNKVNRERRMRSVQLRGFHLLVFLLVVAVSAVIARKAADFILHWDRLNVRYFQMNRAPALESEKLESILKQFRVNILAVDLGELENRLLEISEVKSVSISRILPSTLRIDFHLRTPCFRYWAQGKWQVIDEEGYTIRVAEEEDDSLIPILYTLPEDVERIIPNIGQLRQIGHPLEYVAYRSPHGLELKLQGVPEIFYPGEENVARKMQTFFLLQPQLGQALESVEYVDMRWENRIYLGFLPNQEATREK